MHSNHKCLNQNRTRMPTRMPSATCPICRTKLSVQHSRCPHAEFDKMTHKFSCCFCNEDFTRSHRQGNFQRDLATHWQLNHRGGMPAAAVPHQAAASPVAHPLAPEALPVAPPLAPAEPAAPPVEPAAPPAAALPVAPPLAPAEPAASPAAAPVARGLGHQKVAVYTKTCGIQKFIREIPRYGEKSFFLTRMNGPLRARTKFDWNKKPVPRGQVNITLKNLGETPGCLQTLKQTCKAPK